MSSLRLFFLLVLLPVPLFGAGMQASRTVMRGGGDRIPLEKATLKKDRLIRDATRLKEPILTRPRLVPNLTVNRQPRAMVVGVHVRNEGLEFAFSVPYVVYRKAGGDWREVKRGVFSGIGPGRVQETSFGLPRSPTALTFKLEVGTRDNRQSVVLHVDAEGYL